MTLPKLKGMLMSKILDNIDIGYITCKLCNKYKMSMKDFTQDKMTQFEKHIENCAINKCIGPIGPDDFEKIAPYFTEWTCKICQEVLFKEKFCTTDHELAMSELKKISAFDHVYECINRSIN